MLTRGSRFYFAAALLTYLTAVLYGMLTQTFGVGVPDLLLGDGAVNAFLGPLTFGYKGGVGDHIGYGSLMTFAFGCLVLGLMAVAFRDADAEAQAQVSPEGDVTTQVAPATSNVWPVIGGVSAALIALGLAVDPILMWLGIAGVIVAAVEWSVVAWSEAATGDRMANTVMRRRLMLPVEVPIGGALLLGVVGISFSRLLLAVESNVAITATMVLTTVAFVGAIVLARREVVGKNLAIGAVCAVAVLVLASGIIGAVMGPVEVHKVSSQAELQELHGEEEG